MIAKKEMVRALRNTFNIEVNYDTKRIMKWRKENQEHYNKYHRERKQIIKLMDKRGLYL